MTAATVAERFHQSLIEQPEALAVTLIANGGSQRLTRGDLHRDACRAAASFGRHGVGAGDRVVLAAGTSRATLAALLASWYRGTVPVFAPDAPRDADGATYAAELDHLAERCGARLIVVPDAKAGTLGVHCAAAVVGASVLLDGAAGPELAPAVSGDDLAHLQPTSGSTGSAKLAPITHGNMAANVSAIGRTIGERDGDVIVSWLPLFHDMGLICIACILHWQRPLVLATPASFVRNPVKNWLGLISEHGGTITPAPTSAYQVCVRLAERRAFAGLDLSALRVAFCGAEPIHPQVLSDFERHFAPYGLSSTALLPVYGLAEATLAVTLSDIHAQPRVDHLDAERFERHRQPQPAGTDATRRLPVVSVGSILEGHDLRLVDEAGRSLAQRQVGEIQVRGPSVIAGYWEPASTNGLLTSDGYLCTGDLGYLDGGELYIVGRRKEVIIVNGRNLIPQEVETLASRVIDNGIHQGVAAFGVPSRRSGTEALHLMIESRVAPPPEHAVAEEALRTACMETFGVGGLHIHWVPKGDIPKTTSGKIRRFECAERVAGQR